ncbi:MAG TPA: glycosyltransferase, partial [Gemmataceae bacterium]|nr:glycosyltransferase [Gemmataceae bacterium]
MTVSVIIPTLNEESCVSDTLLLLRQQQPLEIIVADGGSVDGTLQAAADADLVLQGTRGRAAQMNAG